MGAVCVALLSFVNPFVSWLLESWWLVGAGSILHGTVVTLVALVAANGVLVRWWPAAALTRAELLLVYGMMMVTLGFLTQGGMPYILSITTYPFYMATPSNDWQHLIWPYFPTWLQLPDVNAIDWFWEGLPEGVGVPWGVWLSPLVAYSSFALAVMVGMYCLSSLLSRDWIERQRLTFPLVEIPAAITGDERLPTLGTSLLNNKVFWVGAAIPAVHGILLWLRRFYPALPDLGLYRIPIGRVFAGMGLPWNALETVHFSMMFEVLGVMCLIPTEVSLSIWLFYLLHKIHLLVWASFGVAPGQSNAFVDPAEFSGFMEIGGFVALSAFLLYESRRALKRGLLCALGRAREDPDPLAPLSGRAAVIGLTASSAFMLWYASRTGMQLWSFVILMAYFYAVAVAGARLVGASGVMYLDQGVRGCAGVVQVLGARTLSPVSAVMYSLFSAVHMQDPMNMAMPQMMNSFKLTRTARIKGTLLSSGALLAFFAMIVFGLAGMLKMVHVHGATTLPDWPFTDWGRWTFGEMDTNLRDPQGGDNWLRLAVLLGSAIMGGLTWLHLNLALWPVSPVGFIIASSWAVENILWSPALLGWLITAVLKRYGGLRLYRQVRPAFLGLVISAFLTFAITGAIDTVLDYTDMMR